MQTANPRHDHLLISPHHYDDHLFQSLIEQVEVAFSTSNGRKGVSLWIQKNTTNPQNTNEPWSFREHEFQVAIAESEAPRTYVMKRSQIGVSELIVRVALALLAKLSGRHAIYTLPDEGFARNFTPTRFNPVIEASPRLESLVRDDVNNTRIKRIGSSYLHISGAHKEGQSISVPASILIHDETAYSNQDVLGTYASRIGHLKEGEEIVYEFSTPLLPNFAIHQSFLDGTQDTYMCYHSVCSQWVVLDPITSLKVPGLQVPIDQISKQDVINNEDSIKRAYVECPHCKRKIDQDNLADPARRAWVPAYPGRYARSFDANWLVCPAIMTPTKVLRDRLAYKRTEKWVNFAIGRPADSSDNRISEVAIENAFIPERPMLDNTMSAAGMDVGKICHLTVGALLHDDTVVIYDSALPVQDANNNSAKEYVAMYKRHHCLQGVIDAGPEFTVTTHAQTELPYNQVWGCYFVRGTGRQDLEYFNKKEGQGVVNAQRTKAFDEFVAEFNRGKVIFLRTLEHKEMIKKHLRALSRVTEDGKSGEEVVRWVSTGEDHFFMSVFYTWLALQMAGGTSSPRIILPQSAAAFIGKTRMRA